MQEAAEQAHGTRLSPWRTVFVVAVDAEQRHSKAALVAHIQEHLRAIAAYTEDASVLLFVTNIGPETEGLVDELNEVLELCAQPVGVSVTHTPPQPFTGQFVEQQYTALGDETFLHRREMDMTRGVTLVGKRNRPTIVGVVCVDLWTRMAFIFQHSVAHGPSHAHCPLAHSHEVLKLSSVERFSAPDDRVAVMHEVHRIMFDSVRAIHGSVPITYVGVFHALQQLKREDIIPNVYVRKEFFERRNGQCADLGNVGQRSSLMHRNDGPNSYVDREEIVRHLHRCLPSASEAKLRRALVFLHWIGAVHGVEPVSPHSVLNATLYLQPQFLASVIHRSKFRLFKDLPRPENGVLPRRG